MTKGLLIAGTCLALAGCATSSENIGSSYTAPWRYGAYSCQQLAMEDGELVSRVTTLRGQIDRRATNDKIAAGVAIVAFWPAAFLIKGDGEQTAEYARLKGEHEAISQAAAVKGCAAGHGTMETAAYTPAAAAQPYPPAPAPIAYAAAAPVAYAPAPVAYAPAPVTYAPAPTFVTAPYPRGYSETERMRSTQVMVDNYGRE